MTTKETRTKKEKTTKKLNDTIPDDNKNSNGPETHIEDDNKNDNNQKKSGYARLSDTNISILNKVKDKLQLKSLDDVVSELYNMYPWHVLGCEDHAKVLLDRGVVVSFTKELGDALNLERATYFVKGKTEKMENLPEEIRSLIHVK